jgi:putative ABC transport system permease protein
MFIALRDLRFARGRFALLGLVVALLTLMVVMLSGLTAGLGAAGISALVRLPADHLAFQRPAADSVSFTGSSVSAKLAARAARVPGVESAEPLGLAPAKLSSAEGRRQDGSSGKQHTVAVGLLGVSTGSGLAPRPEQGRPAVRDDQVLLSTEASEELDVGVGDTLRGSGGGTGGRTVTVSGIADNGSYSHLPAVFATLPTWQALTHSSAPTVLALRTSAEGFEPAALDRALGGATTTRDKTGAYSAVSGYAAEQASLNLMRGLLLVVSALVVGAYFTVWTVQRGHDLAVVRAMGASRGYLLRDALAQALVVLLLGGAAGTVAALGAGVLAARAAPFVLSAWTVLLPFAAMTVVGLLGAAVTVRRVASVDPLTALGAGR